MWIEVYDSSTTAVMPEPINLQPLLPEQYELRVIVWNTSDIILNDTNIFGTAMSDIYVKGYNTGNFTQGSKYKKNIVYRWLDNVDDAQFTDIHYRSLTGEGKFNWRLIFPLLYSRTEDMVHRRNLRLMFPRSNIFIIFLFAQMLVTKKKRFYEQFDTEIKMPVNLNIQVWDNDALSADDFLGKNS